MWRQYPHRLAWAGCDRQAKKSRSACHLTVTFGMRVVLCSSIPAPSLVGGRSTDGSSARSQTPLQMPPPEEIQLPHHVGGRTHKGPAKLAVANYGYGTTLPTTRGSSCSKRPVIWLRLA